MKSKSLFVLLVTAIIGGSTVNAEPVDFTTEESANELSNIYVNGLNSYCKNSASLLYCSGQSAQAISHKCNLIKRLDDPSGVSIFVDGQEIKIRPGTYTTIFFDVFLANISAAFPSKIVQTNRWIVQAQRNAAEEQRRTGMLMVAPHEVDYFSILASERSFLVDREGENYEKFKNQYCQPLMM
ncbi:hypothetical protein K2X05_07795 [bacterium]|nr:hypothetical protein [bacterium]